MTIAPDLPQRQALDLARCKKLVQKVKIAQQQLGMDDDAYRALLQSETGLRSAALLKSWQLENVLKRMQKLGFKVKPPKQAGTRPLSTDKQDTMIRGLWLELHQVGKVNDPSESALVNFVKGQFKTTQGIEALQWLNTWQKQHLIEQLKKWLER